MDQRLTQYVSQDPKENVTFARAQQVQAYGNQFKLTSSIVGIPISQAAPDADSVGWDKQQKVMDAGYQEGDLIRWGLVYDQYPQGAHDVGGLYQELTAPGFAPLGRMKKFASDIASTLMTLNPNAGVTENGLVIQMLGDAAAPVVEASFDVLK